MKMRGGEGMIVLGIIGTRAEVLIDRWEQRNQRDSCSSQSDNNYCDTRQQTNMKNTFLNLVVFDSVDH